MSLLADRQQLTAALDAVSVLSGFSDPADTISSPGDAYARWTGLEAQGAPLLFLVNWEIVIVAGRTQSDGLAFLDTNLSAILDALDSLVWISAVRPSVIQTPNGDLFGVVIEAKKES